MATKEKLNKDEILGAIENLTVLELAELVRALEERFGVSAAAPVAVAAAPRMAVGAPAVAVEEQTEFDAVLAAVGDKKIQVIKVVRELTGLGLKEAKELVDTAPKPVKEKVSKQEAEQIKEKLAGEGAKVDIKYRRRSRPAHHGPVFYSSGRAPDRVLISFLLLDPGQDGGKQPHIPETGRTRHASQRVFHYFRRCL